MVKISENERSKRFGGLTMEEYLSRVSKAYRNKYLKITNLDNPDNVTRIDFCKPWWHVFLQNKWKLAIILSGVVFSFTIATLLPMLFKSAIESQKTINFFYIFLVWITIEAWRPVTAYVFSVLISSVITGVNYSAYKFFLTVDPIFHARRVGGEIVAKIQRCTKAFDKFLDKVMYDVLPIIVRVTTVIVLFFVANFTLGLITFCFLAFMLLINVLLVLFNSFSFERSIIKADDSSRASSVESLMQIGLVRSSFATNEMNKVLLSKNSSVFAVLGTYYISFFNLMFLIKILYATSVCVLGAYILHLVKSEMFTVLQGTTLIVTYIHGTYRSMRIGMRVRKIVQASIQIKDLFAFIRNFGMQTFPVLKEDLSVAYEVPSLDVVDLQASNLSFAYEDIDIFKDHNLKVEVPQSQQNKMYGIIGPSGVGKTTLISILGGQIKPDKGQVVLNGVPIYHINDNLKRKLIAIQGQSASSLSGTLKSSLLLGVPKGISVFTDDYLVEILKRVGIWHIFKNKGGLYAQIGEGGLNLSVGQRQRLNFASLYLRTKYYKPLLVMIDEPTSSLDEVSEQAITDMIEEIAATSLVFVIAHRLNTLESAVALLDCSLMEQEKDLKFYSRDELKNRSVYYQKLMRGEVAIEE